MFSLRPSPLPLSSHIVSHYIGLHSEQSMVSNYEYYNYLKPNSTFHTYLWWVKWICFRNNNINKKPSTCNYSNFLVRPFINEAVWYRTYYLAFSPQRYHYRLLSLLKPISILQFHLVKFTTNVVLKTYSLVIAKIFYN